LLRSFTRAASIARGLGRPGRALWPADTIADRLSLAYAGLVSETYFQRGFKLGKTITPLLEESYHSEVVDRVKELGYAARAGDVRLKLAREFGFCYGVDRAVQYAYETREQFPDRRIFLSGEIIHNPDVNRRIQEMGIVRLDDAPDPEARYGQVTREDVVLVPAFGVTATELAYLRAKGCVLVDTTCGSVLNVWKNVRRYAREGYTAVIHGKLHHEETRATASQAVTQPGGRYLCVKDQREAGAVCAFMRGETDREQFVEAFERAMSPGFEPARDLERIGLANQTTMLMSESLEIQAMLRAALCDRYGEAELAERFRAFDTICSATQDRQDAVLRLLNEGGLDVMIVIGGYNSSNTQALTRLGAERVPTYHINGARCIEGNGIRHRPVGGTAEVVATEWLPVGAVCIGLTAGASTPNNIVGDAIQRLLALRGLKPEDLGPA
jgi:4-hydroxy-3-methylbut-2-enyl diphosphate reductase